MSLFHSATTTPMRASFISGSSSILTKERFFLFDDMLDDDENWKLSKIEHKQCIALPRSRITEK
jgi:hypothetical protein